MAASKGNPYSQAKPYAGQGERADSILKGLGKILRHDLPNQLVIFQGLLQLLDMEESDRLSPSGKEYLQRLKKVSERTLDLAGYLKEFFQLAGGKEVSERVNLARLVEDLQLQIQQDFPIRNLTWEIKLQVTEIQAGRNSLQRAMLELIRLTFANVNCPGSVIHCQAVREGQDFRIRLHLAPQGPLRGIFPSDIKNWESKIEWLLAQELLAGVRGSLNTQLAEPNVTFILGIPGSGKENTKIAGP